MPKISGSAPSACDVLFIGVALSPDGRTGYASGHTESGYNDVIYPATIAPGPSISRGPPIALPHGSYPAGLAMSKDGSRLYVAENLANKLGVMDTQTNTLVAEIPVGRQPWGVALHPMLPQVYVTNRVDRTVSVVDTETMQVDRHRSNRQRPECRGREPEWRQDLRRRCQQRRPHGVRRQSRRRACAASRCGPSRARWPGSSPNALAFAPDGSRLYVANAWDNAIVVLSPDTRADHRRHSHRLVPDCHRSEP